MDYQNATKFNACNGNSAVISYGKLLRYFSVLNFGQNVAEQIVAIVVHDFKYLLMYLNWKPNPG